MATTCDDHLLDVAVSQALLLLTRAGILKWKRGEQARAPDMDAALKGQEVARPSMFFTDIQIHAGQLEEVTGLPLPLQDEGLTTDVGLRVRLLCNDEINQEDVTFPTDLELLGEIEKSVREEEEFLSELGRIFESGTRQ